RVQVPVDTAGRLELADDDLLVNRAGVGAEQHATAVAAAVAGVPAGIRRRLAQPSDVVHGWAPFRRGSARGRSRPSTSRPRLPRDAPGRRRRAGRTSATARA